MNRDNKGKFIKGHKLDNNALIKMSRTKQRYPDVNFVCEYCKISFIARIDKHHPKRRFCSIKCCRGQGARTGQKNSEYQKQTLSKLYTGAGNPLWRGGICRSKRNKDKARHKAWREAVFARDNYICQVVVFVVAS